MINRLFILFLLVGSSTATKGLRRAQQDGVPASPGVITTQSDGLPPPKDTSVKVDSVAEKKAKENKVKEDKVKEEKEKKAKTCRKRAKEVVDSPPVRSLQFITNEDGLPKADKVGPAVVKEDTAVPPPPVSPPETMPDTTVDEDSTVDPAEADAIAEEDLPFCADVGKKSRSRAECDALLASVPDHKKITGEIQFEVQYDEDDADVLEDVKKTIKKKAARKAAGCTEELRRTLQETTGAVDDEFPSTVYISGVSFGEFIVNDKCASGLADGCDNVVTPVEIYYESEDNRDATDEEAEIMMSDVIKAIQGEQTAGATTDNFVGEIHTNGKSGKTKGIIAGAAVAGTALAAGAVVYKRYGSDLMAKWA